MSYTEHTITEHGTRTRVRWVLDELHDPAQSWALNDPQEQAEAVAQERADLESGKYVALGAIVEHRTNIGADDHKQNDWAEADTLWGIVIEPEADKLHEFAEQSLDLEPPPIKPRDSMGIVELATELHARRADAIHGGYALAYSRLGSAIRHFELLMNSDERKLAEDLGARLALARINYNRAELGMPELSSLDV